MTMQLPKITNYGQYSGDNYGAHTLMIEMDSFRIYYSYETIVAYSDIQDGLVCSKNIWTNTTAKHLSWIQPVKSDRIPNDEFQEMLEEMLKRNINQ